MKKFLLLSCSVFGLFASCTAPAPVSDSCSPSYCSSHGECTEVKSLPSCACADGYGGLTCNTCTVGFHRVGSSGCAVDEVCTETSCSGHGTCAVSGGVSSCACAAGYDGPTCASCYGDYLAIETDAGVDAGVTCISPQKCTGDSCAPGFDCDDSTGVIQCACTGPSCEKCAAGSCSANGSCDDSTGRVRCTCNSGYSGSSCGGCSFGYSQSDAGVCFANQGCALNSCSGGGTCSASTGIVTCSCDSEYAGAFCQSCATGHHRNALGACVVDQVCATNSCPANATCEVNQGTISCPCKPGYAGQLCNNCYPGYHLETGRCVLDARCQSSSCGGGVCEDATGSIACSMCPAGLSGANCEVNTDDCGTACNSGRCIDLVNSRVCLCTDGTYGQTCLPGPTVTATTPSSGTIAGGYTVTFTGTLFSGSTVVTIDGLAAPITNVTSTSLTVTVPAGRSVGPKNAVIRNTNGQRATVTFTYTAFAFSYTGANQTFTVPAGVTSLRVRLWGAGGGGGNASTVRGGAGGYVYGTLQVTPSQVFTIVVGQGGAQIMTPTKAGVGGGYSGVFFGAVSQANARIIAGGGGGGGFFSNATWGSSGGNGGGDFGGDGAVPQSTSYAARGLGGSSQAGGVGGCSTNPPNAQCGQNGTALVGGGGGVGGLTFTRTGATFGGGGGVGASTSFNSGGGGGGYFGGGGGANDTASGGGGGSGYLHSTVTNGVSATAVNPGEALAQNEVGYTAGSAVGGNVGTATAGGNGLVLISW